MKLYFTFGTGGQPYVGGWVEVEAETIEQAVKLYRAVYPDKHEGIINCSSIYNEEEFKSTEMYKNGENFGSGCHESISLQRKKTV